MKNAIIELDQPLVNRRAKPLEAVIKCFMVGDSTLSSDVLTMLAMIAPTPDLSLSLHEIPHIIPRSLFSKDSAISDAPFRRNSRSAWVSDGVSNILRNRTNIGADARGRFRTDSIPDVRINGVGGAASMARRSIGAMAWEPLPLGASTPGPKSEDYGRQARTRKKHGRPLDPREATEDKVEKGRKAGTARASAA